MKLNEKNRSKRDDTFKPWLKKIITLFLIIALVPISAFAQVQGLTITGKVKDDTGGEMPGVNVYVKQKSVGTITDIDGNYSISEVKSRDILVFSSIGMATQEILITDQTVINISLLPASFDLNEVVAVGYGNAKKSDLTGSVVNADLESFQEAPNTSILQSLSGTVPGLNIGQSTSAGGQPAIEIRGRTSLNGNLSPLIVLDGAIFRGSMGDINPSDIKSVNVLKDASSKAVYGAQAANGVILITTNKGKSGEPSITYSTYYTHQTPIKDYRPLRRDAFIKAARDLAWDEGYIGPDYTEENPEWDPRSRLSSQGDVVAGIENGVDYDWFGALTDPGFIKNHQLSLRGGTDKSTYFLSGGYTKQKNWMLNDEFDRKTVRINYDTEATSWLTIGANTFGSFSDYSGDGPSLYPVTVMTPFVTPKDEDGNWIPAPAGSAYGNGFLTAESEDIDKRNRISGVFYGILNIPKVEGLTYRVNYSHNYQWNTRFNSNQYGAGQTGTAHKGYSSTYDQLLDNIVQYDKKIGGHTLGATLLAGRNKIEYDGSSLNGNGFENIDLGYHSLPQANVQTMTSSGWDESFSYQMARVNYNYKNKYLLTGTVRRDGYSGFAENKKTAYFPSVGASWVISEELSLDESVISYLKARFSYGETGNLTGRYRSLAIVQATDYSKYVFGDGGSTSNGQVPTSLANANLTWETTTGLNYGLDFSLFDQKISGSVDYYNSTTTDLLWYQNLPGLTGFYGVHTNLGKITNKGIEAILNAKVVNSSNWKWDVSLNFSANKNEVNELLGQDNDGDGKEDDLISSGLFIGESIGSIYNYPIEGMWQIADQENLPAGFHVGTYKLRDTNGDGEYTPDDREIIGRSEPAYRFGIQNTVKYKRLSLRFFIKGVQGGKDGYLGGMDFNRGQSTFEFNFLDNIKYWSPSNPDAPFIGLGVSNPLPVTRYFDRSFVRLQDISLSYDLNMKYEWLNSIGMKGFKVYVSGKNLVTLSDWPGWDPETGNSNGMPLMKSVTGGLEVSF